MTNPDLETTGQSQRQARGASCAAGAHTLRAARRIGFGDSVESNVSSEINSTTSHLPTFLVVVSADKLGVSASRFGAEVARNKPRKGNVREMSIGEVDLEIRIRGAPGGCESVRARHAADTLLADVVASLEADGKLDDFGEGGWKILNASLCPALELQLDEHAAQTLQSLGLWPGGTLVVQAAEDVETASKSAETAAEASHTVLPSAVLAAPLRRFDDADPIEGFAGREHHAVRTSAAAAAEASAAAAKTAKVRKYEEQSARGVRTAGGRRVSEQVRRMLIRSHATGPVPRLDKEEKFHCEIVVSAPVSDSHDRGRSDDAMQSLYLVFPRQWSVGRVINEALRVAHAKTTFDAAALAQFTLRRKATSDATDATAAPPAALPCDARLVDLAHSGTLCDFDCLLLTDTVTERPPPPVTTSQPPPTPTETDPEPAPPLVEGVCKLETANESEKSQQMDTTADDVTPAGEAVTVVQGSVSHVVDGLVFSTCTVLELKGRAAALFGIPVEQQRLVFKGTLSDSDLLSTTKLRAGSRIVLMRTEPRPAR